MVEKRILWYEIAGIIFIIFLGSALHFTYEFSGESKIVGVFSAVNESVWEHMKLAFWPSLIWLAIEYYPFRKIAKNFFSAKAIGTYLMVFLIPLVFYSYTSVTGESIFAIDITTFIVAVVLGQLLSYAILKYKKLPALAEVIAVALLILLAASFIIFTFYTPHLPIFRDPITGGYGINAQVRRPMSTKDFTEYKRREFCKDVQCPRQMKLNKLNENSPEYEQTRQECKGACCYTTWQFHHWLIEKGYLILKPKTSTEQ
jgi:hypothetical protein